MKEMKESKEVLIDKIIDNLKFNIYESHDYIFDLVKESLKRRTKSDLKQILYGE